MAHTAGQLYESLSINKSLRKSYNEIYRKLKDSDDFGI